MANTNTIAKHYARLLALWPKDALRPTLPFARAIEHRSHPYGVPPSTSPSTTTPRAPPPAPRETAQLNALFSLLENRYSTKYALPPAVLRPASAPLHYTRLMAEIERAPRKTWWEAKVDEWRTKVRWS